MAQSIVFLYPKKAKVHGLQQDALLLEKCLKMEKKIRHADPFEAPSYYDVAVHFEIPIYGWMPWASTNIFVINTEWWEDAWNPYLERADVLIFKSDADKYIFNKDRNIHSSIKQITIPWTSHVTTKDFTKSPLESENACLWMLGASVNKRKAADKIIPLWKDDWPILHVYTKQTLSCQCPVNVKINVKDLEDDSERLNLQSKYPCHLIFSASESLSLVAHEGLAAGAFLLGNSLPTYVEAFSKLEGVFLTESTLVPNKAGVMDTFENVEKTLEVGMQMYLHSNRKSVYDFNRKRSSYRYDLCKDSMYDLRKIFVGGKPCVTSKTQLPPVTQDLPSISVVTLLYNRRKFVDLALHNLISTDYPKDKIEWIVVEDSDIQEEQASDKIIKFGRQASPMSVSYIPLQKKTSIGEKRNMAVNRAQNDIILMMDDDDHYPVTSFRRRVSWLLEHPWQPNACACTTIACYDLIKGTSAVNSPPFNLALRERVSEATLTFKKSWWQSQKFPEVSIAEGEDFLKGREDEVLELPPQHIIVAMSHGKNISSRRIPETPSGKASCFWGFPKEFLTFLHGLVGIQLEDM